METKWKYPQYKVPSNLLDVTDAMLIEWDKETCECNEHNKKLQSDLIILKNKIITEAIFIWGEKSNVVRYLQKQSIHIPSYSYFDSNKDRVLKAREEEQKRIQNVETTNKLIELQGKAIKYLIDKGKLINIDFTIDNVLSIANTIAYDEAIAAKQKELAETHSYIDFNGSDNCENCAGWDGTSRRCQCGNRRVGWDSHDNADFFLNPYVYGEAW